MNPKIPDNLDPKLKETYERVMGTSLNPATPPLTQPRPVQTTVVQEPQPVATVIPQPVSPTPAAPPPPINAANPTPIPQPLQMSKDNDAAKKAALLSAANTIIKGNKTTSKKINFLKPLLLIVGGFIFFVAYALIWAKIFHVL